MAKHPARARADTGSSCDRARHEAKHRASAIWSISMTDENDSSRDPGAAAGRLVRAASDPDEHPETSGTAEGASGRSEGDARDAVAGDRHAVLVLFRGELASLLLCCVVAVVACLGCDARPSNAQQDGGTGPDGSPLDVCDRFISCAFAATPTTASTVVATYGPNGTCWADQPADVCQQGCRSGLSSVRAAYPTVMECACRSRADCPTAYIPCTSDAQCSTGMCVHVETSGVNGSFCTNACTNDANCGQVGGFTGACYELGLGGQYCYQHCSQASDCPSGSRCLSIILGAGSMDLICVPN